MFINSKEGSLEAEPPQFEIVFTSSESIFNQEFEYNELQRILFQENKIIPKEIWPQPDYGSWNHIDSHPRWTIIREAKEKFLSEICN